MSARRPKILHCISHLALGGAEEVALSIIELLHADYDFGVFTVRSGVADAVGRRMQKQLRDLNVPVFQGTSVDFKYGGALFAARSLRRAINEFKPDIIHLHTEMPELCSALLPKSRRRLVVQTIHNSMYWYCWKSLGRFCARRLNPSAVIAVSDGSKQEYFRHCTDSRVPADARLIHKIYSAVNVKPLSRPFQSKHPELLRGIFAGRLEKQKGADLLPEILERMVANYEGALSFDLFGDGAYAEQIGGLQRLVSPKCSVSVQGPVANLRAILPEYDFLIMPSRFEGLGLVAVEAILSGIMVIATDADGLREALPDDYPWRAKCGSAESFSQTLVDALSRYEEWPEVLRSAQAFCLERFSPDKMADNYRAVYSSILKDSGNE